MLILNQDTKKHTVTRKNPLANWHVLETQETDTQTGEAEMEYHWRSARRHEEYHWRLQDHRHRMPELQAPVFVRNVCCRLGC